MLPDKFDDRPMRSLQKVFLSPWKLRLYMLSKLPMGFLSGMRVPHLDGNRCETEVRYRWLNKNPFRSTFWAVLGMAAELSTGALVMYYTHKQTPSIAIIVRGCTGSFHKRAVGKTRFICQDGPAVAQAVRQAVETGEGVEVTCVTKGYDEEQHLVADFSFTWSMKVRKAKG